MKLIICKNCNSAFTPLIKLQKCHCGQTSGRLINNITHYSGEYSVPVNISDVDIISDLNLTDIDAVKEAGKIKYSGADRDFCVKIIEYLNQCAGTTFSTSFPSSHCDLIIQRRNEHNVSADDFFRVIQNKCVQWLNTQQEIYLRPTTLFNKTKFANYLGERHGTKPTVTAKSFDQLADNTQQAKRNIIERGREGGK